MDRSQYLVQALQALSQQPTGMGASTVDLGALKQQADTAQAFRAANPGKSPLMGGLRQAGQNLMGAPARVGGLFSLGGAATKSPGVGAMGVRPQKAQGGGAGLFGRIRTG
jgi:hypothetical protein